MKARTLSAAFFALTAVTCTSCSQAGGIDAASKSMMQQSTSSNTQALPSMADDGQLSSSSGSETPSPQPGSNPARPNHRDPYLPPQAVLPQHPSAEAKPSAPATPSTSATQAPEGTSTNAEAPRPSRPVPVLPTSPDGTAGSSQTPEPKPGEQTPKWPGITEPKKETDTTPDTTSKEESKDGSPFAPGSEPGLPKREPLLPKREQIQPETQPTTENQAAPAAEPREEKPFYCSWSNSFPGVSTLTEKCA